MRAAPLTTVNGGINRLRTKGGARADSLYDLVNGFVTEVGTVVSRPGTERIATLNPLTRGLCAFGDKLYTFCHKAVEVPYGFELGILVSPNTGTVVAAPGTPAFDATFDIHTGRGSIGSLSTSTGADPEGYVNGTPFGSFTAGRQLTDDLFVYGTHCVGPYATPDAQTAFVLRLATGVVGSVSTTPAPTVFDTVEFVDELGGTRTLNRVDADEPDGTDQTGFRSWVWTLPSALVMANGGDYTLTITLAGEAETEAAYEATLSEIHFAEPFMGAPYVVAEFSDGGVYHYWLQAGTQWEANAVYKAGDIVYPSVATGLVYRASRLGSANPPWAANVPRFDGTGGSGYEQSIVEPTVYNDYYYTCIATTGTNPRSGTVEPDWPTDDGATIIESTDNPPDVNIPTTVVVEGTTPSSDVRDRYGRFNDRQVLR